MKVILTIVKIILMVLGCVFIAVICAISYEDYKEKQKYPLALTKKGEYNIDVKTTINKDSVVKEYLGFKETYNNPESALLNGFQIDTYLLTTTTNENIHPFFEKGLIDQNEILIANLKHEHIPSIQINVDENNNNAYKIDIYTDSFANPIVTITDYDGDGVADYLQYNILDKDNRRIAFVTDHGMTGQPDRIVDWKNKREQFYYEGEWHNHQIGKDRIANGKVIPHEEFFKKLESKSKMTDENQF